MTKEDVLLASLFNNLKGSKKKREDWINIAEQCKKILDESDDNRKIAAKKLGVSPELIRSIVSLLDLPVDVQDLIKKGRILFDAAQRINSIKLPDEKKTRS